MRKINCRKIMRRFYLPLKRDVLAGIITGVLSLTQVNWAAPIDASLETQAIYETVKMVLDQEVKDRGTLSRQEPKTGKMKYLIFHHWIDGKITLADDRVTVCGEFEDIDTEEIWDMDFDARQDEGGLWKVVDVRFHQLLDLGVNDPQRIQQRKIEKYEEIEERDEYLMEKRLERIQDNH